MSTTGDNSEATVATRKRATRLLEVDRVTAVAILLVVIGHVASRGVPPGAEWFDELAELIYKFHMPLFLFVSGLVFMHTSKPVRSRQDYFVWVKAKVLRLAPGFFGVGIAIVVGKMIASQFMHVDNQRAELLPAFAELIYLPGRSAATSLWYIYVLLQYYLVFPLLLILLRGRVLWLVLIGVVMHMLFVYGDLTKLFMIDWFSEYFLVFSLGCLAAVNYARVLGLVKRYGWLFVALFVLSFLSLGVLGWFEAKLVIGLCSIPALFYLVGVLGSPLDQGLLFISKYTFAIYLFNTIAIGLAKGFALQFVAWDEANFPALLVLFVAAGVFVPIALHRYYFLYCHPWLRSLFSPS